MAPNFNYPLHAPVHSAMGAKPDESILRKPKLGAAGRTGAMATSAGPASEGWPYCVHVSGDCPLHDAIDRLGDDAYHAFSSFVKSQDEGGRLSLEAMPTGFSMTLTDPVARTGGPLPDIAALRSVRAAMDRPGHAPADMAAPFGNAGARRSVPNTTARRDRDVACAYTDDGCAALHIAHSLGTNVFSTFLVFSGAAKVGDRLTLQRNREGFSVQVTRAVNGPASGGIDTT